MTILGYVTLVDVTMIAPDPWHFEDTNSYLSSAIMNLPSSWFVF